MRRIIRELLMSLSLLLKADKLKQTLTWSGRMFQVSAAQYNTIPHSINYEEIGTSEGLWDHLGKRKMTNMSFSTFSKPVALLCEAELTRAKLGALKTSKNDMFFIFRLPR